MGGTASTSAPGSEGATLLPEFGPAPTDVVLSRWHGVGPMGGTDLDAILRNLGVTTIVAVGVSVNIAITNLVMDAVNAGYRVVVPRDAVAGIPTDYATRSSTTRCRCWRRSPPPTTCWRPGSDRHRPRDPRLSADRTDRRAAGDGPVHGGDAQAAGHRGVDRSRRRAVDRGAQAHRGPVRAARSPPGAAGRRSRRPGPPPARPRSSAGAAVDAHRVRARRRHHARTLQPVPRRRQQRRARRGHPAVLSTGTSA